MYVLDGNAIPGDQWVTYSYDDSGEPATLVQTQPQHATLEQLALMGVTVEADPPPPEPAPMVVGTISDRQFYQQLAVDGVMTQDEAIAAVTTGTLPAAVDAFITSRAADEQFAAEMKLRGATVFYRSDPLFVALGESFGYTPDQLDALWNAASML